MRNKILFNDHWRFTLADGELLSPVDQHASAQSDAGLTHAANYQRGPIAMKFDDLHWRVVTLPHDFVLERPFLPEDSLPEFGKVSSAWHGAKPGAVGWYRKRFAIPAEDEGRRIVLHFEGVYRDCAVFLNHFSVRRHASGYASFSIDITDFVNYGGENVLAVRVDATQHEGWWYEGGGIYRHVWLERTAPIHIATDGVFVRANVNFDGDTPSAEIAINTALVNETNTPAHCTFRTVAIDPHGNAVAEAESSIDVPAAGESDVPQIMSITPAQLWSLDQPKLYRLVSTVIQDASEVDQIETNFGIRSIRFDAEKGFFLNEQPLKIQGMCCHQDHAGVGVAIPDTLHEYRIQKLKEMGCNACRSAHHPASPALLDACDRLGMLVLSETRMLSSSDEYAGQFAGMIRRDRNHPSVILWGLGNEEIYIQFKPQAGRIVHSLKQIARRLDPTRPTTLAFVHFEIVDEGGFETGGVLKKWRPSPATPELDVMGFNYTPEFWEEFHAANPQQPMIVTEATSSRRTRGCYASDDVRGWLGWDDPRCEIAGAETQWSLVAQHDYISGIFLWTGFDYRGESAPHGWPAISSHYGVLDTCGFAKDNAFYYQAYWRPEPLVHVFPHWNWADRIGQPVDVFAYSNCDEVELFVNGVSQGRQTMPAYGHLSWREVTYAPGKLEAIGYRNGEAIARDVVETTGAPAAIRLRAHRDGLRAASGDVAVIDVEVVDEAGRILPTADNDITFSVKGGMVLGVGNGDPSSHEDDKAGHRRTFNGRCQVIVQAGDDASVIEVTARANGLTPAVVKLRVE